jgi:hypothetical protein
MYQWSFWKLPEAFIWNAINSTGLSVSGILLISVNHMVLFFQGVFVYSFKEIFDSSLHLPFMVFFHTGHAV